MSQREKSSKKTSFKKITRTTRKDNAEKTIRVMNADKHIALFISTILEKKQLWGIATQENWVVCDSIFNDSFEVIPFWSSKEGAALHCVDEWQNHQPRLIELDNFIDFWLVELANDNVLIGPDWNQTLQGEEVTALDIEKKLLQIKSTL